jgi:hypothetical protein
VHSFRNLRQFSLQNLKNQNKHKKFILSFSPALHQNITDRSLSKDMVAPTQVTPQAQHWPQAFGRNYTWDDILPTPNRTITRQRTTQTRQNLELSHQHPILAQDITSTPKYGHHKPNKHHRVHTTSLYQYKYKQQRHNRSNRNRH